MIEKLNPAIKKAIAVAMVLIALAIVTASVIIGQKEPKPEPVVIQETIKVYEAPTMPAVKNLPKALPTEADKREAEAVAIEFIRSFHSFDAAAPDAYYKLAEPYMTDKLKDLYKGILKRSTIQAQKIRVVGTDALPSELQEDLQIWTVVATSEETAADGSIVETFHEYSVMLIKEEGQWLVDGVKIIER